MEQRQYRGSIEPNALAQHMLDTWDQGDTVAQALEGDEGLIVQIGQRSEGFFSHEPDAALTAALEAVSDGLRVTLGEQQWYRDQGGQIMVGGLIGFFPFFFTWPLGGGHNETVDPNLATQVWASIEEYIRSAGAATGETHRLPQEPVAATGETHRLPQEPTAATGETHRLPQEPTAATGETTRLQGIRCPTCGTDNIPGAERCQACGTFLQAQDCPKCGVSNPATANFCMRCGTNLHSERTTTT